MRAEAPVRADAERRLATAHSLRKTFARILNSNARVVEWQTRTFEGRMPKGMRVQVPPRALRFARFCGSDSTSVRLKRLAGDSIITRFAAELELCALFRFR
jgi:hypothetical protein